MPDQLSTDLTAAPGPPFLFSESTLAMITDEEKSEGKYTLERLRTQRPEALEEIVRLVGEGLSARRIAKLVRVHQQSVAQVIAQEPRAIDAVRSKLGPKLLAAVTLQVDRLIDDPECVPRNVIGLTAVQLLTQYQLVTGQATSRVEIVEKPQGEDLHRQFNALLDELPQASARVVEEAPAMGLSEGKIEAHKGEVDEAEARSTDGEAVDSPEQEESATRSDTQETGGRGGSPQAGGRPAQTRWKAQKIFNPMATTPEFQLAAAWGVPREALKKIRREKLLPDRDYTIGRGGAIEINEAGAKKMRGELGLPHENPFTEAAPATGGKPALPWRDNDLVARAHNGDPEAKHALQRHHVLIVEKLAANKITVICRTETGETATLCVRDNRNFMRGMKVQTCVHVRASHYDFEGRLPRRKGRF